MTLKNVRLELVRCADFPEGSSEFGYEIVPPLSNDGHIDTAGWEKVAEACTVRRFWKHEDDENGLLVHTNHGWIFDYDPDAEDDDEPLFRLDDHRFNPGEYVSVTEHDGVKRTDQLVDIHEASGLSFKSASVIIHACRNSRKQWS